MDYSFFQMAWTMLLVMRLFARAMDIFGEIINKINYEKLDGFVKMLVTGYISRRGSAIVKKDIDADAPSDTSNFLTHIIEVGSLNIMQDNSLITSNENSFEGAAVVSALALNISMATALKEKDVFDLDSPVYYAGPTLEAIISRIISHIQNPAFDNQYVKSLTNNYLLNKI